MFLFGGMLLLHRRGPALRFGYALLSIIIVYVIFRLVFKVVLPEGIIPERRILADLGEFFAKLIGADDGGSSNTSRWPGSIRTCCS